MKLRRRNLALALKPDVATVIDRIARRRNGDLRDESTDEEPMRRADLNSRRGAREDRGARKWR